LGGRNGTIFFGDFVLILISFEHDNRQTMSNNSDTADAPSTKMTPGDNPLKYLRNKSKTENEVFTATLEWCRKASLLEHCPKLIGGNVEVPEESWVTEGE
jgi:hypothetical protein